VLRLFVTGTDTGVGKTRIAAALCMAYAARRKRVAAMKPVASGCTQTSAGLRSEDAEALLAAMTVRAAYDEVNPYAFEPAIAPHIAATEAGCSIDFQLLDGCYERLCRHSDVIIVEGAGGWLAPLDATHTFADLAVRWKLDVILVVGLRLGCLNHALLTAEAIETRGLQLAGWVGNSVDPNFERREANTDTLRTRLAANCLGILPYSPDSSAREISNAFLSVLPE
jgi:dethiobiotin synthetase